MDQDINEICPPEIVRIVGKILARGYLNIREKAHVGDVDGCFAEADHLHNLPDVLVDYRSYMLPFYWDIERRSFLDEIKRSGVTGFEAIWLELEPFVEAIRADLDATGK